MGSPSEGLFGAGFNPLEEEEGEKGPGNAPVNSTTFILRYRRIL